MYFERIGYIFKVLFVALYIFCFIYLLYTFLIFRCERFVRPGPMRRKLCLATTSARGTLGIDPQGVRVLPDVRVPPVVRGLPDVTGPLKANESC